MLNLKENAFLGQLEDHEQEKAKYTRENHIIILFYKIWERWTRNILREYKYFF